MAGAFRRAASREMDKLKKMSAGDRVWYLWEYYRFHLFVCLALLAVIGYAGSILYRNSFDTVLTCYVVRSVETESMKSGGNAERPADGDTAADGWLERELSACLPLGEKELVEVDASLVMSAGEGVSDYVYASMARISAAISAGQLDVIIGDAEVIRYYGEIGALEPAASWADSRQGTDAAPGSLEDTVPLYALPLKDLPALQPAGISMDEPYFALVKGSSHTGYAGKMYEFLRNFR